jgi:hypothetical protein
LTLPVLIILAVLWGVVLVPPLLRSRSQRTADSIVDFNYKLDVLGRTNGHRLGWRRRAESTPEALSSGMSSPGMSPPGMSSSGMSSPEMSPALPPGLLGGPPLSAAPAQRAAKRRRDIFRGLALAVSCTFLLAISAHSGLAWGLQILVDLVAVAYVALWAWARSVQADRVDKVRYMPELRVPELAMRRSASS